MTFYLAASHLAASRTYAGSYERFVSGVNRHARVLYNGIGHEARLDRVIRDTHVAQRRIVLFESDGLAEIDTTFFLARDRELRTVKGLATTVLLVQQPSDVRTTHSYPFVKRGGVEEMIEEYAKAAKTDGGTILLQAFKDKRIHDALVKKNFFGKMKMYPVAVSVGLHTTNEHYLICPPVVSHLMDERWFAQESLKYGGA